MVLAPGTKDQIAQLTRLPVTIVVKGAILLKFAKSQKDTVQKSLKTLQVTDSNYDVNSIHVNAIQKLHQNRKTTAVSLNGKAIPSDADRFWFSHHCCLTSFMPIN